MAKLKVIMGEVDPQPDNSWMILEGREGYTQNKFKGNGHVCEMPSADNSVILRDMYTPLVGSQMSNMVNGWSFMKAPSWRFYNDDGTPNPSVDPSGSKFGFARYATLSVEHGFDYRCNEGTGELGFDLHPVVKELCDIINPTYTGLAWGMLKVSTIGSTYDDTTTKHTSRWYQYIVSTEFVNTSSYWLYYPGEDPEGVKFVCSRMDGEDQRALSYGSYGRLQRHAYTYLPIKKWVYVDTQDLSPRGYIYYNTPYMKNEEELFMAFPYYTSGILPNGMGAPGKGGQ